MSALRRLTGRRVNGFERAVHVLMQPTSNTERRAAADSAAERVTRIESLH